LKGAELLGLAAADCVVVEDAPAGIRSGKAAGARVIALQTTEHDSLLREAGAAWIVNTCACVSVAGEARDGNITLVLQTGTLKEF
jgi:sugar-phosphatase